MPGAIPAVASWLASEFIQAMRLGFLFMLLLNFTGCISIISARKTAFYDDVPDQYFIRELRLNIIVTSAIPERDDNKLLRYSPEVIAAFHDSKYFEQITSSSPTTFSADVEMHFASSEDDLISPLYTHVLFLFPKKFTRPVTITTIFKDRFGHELAKVSKQGQVKIVAQWLLLPLGFIYTPHKANKKIVYRLCRQSLIEARSQGAFKNL